MNNYVAKYILAIDPGTNASGVCLIRTEDMKPLWAQKINNPVVQLAALQIILGAAINTSDVQLVIERMQGNNMPVSASVFETCEWIGRFDIMFHSDYASYPKFEDSTRYVYRRDEYRTLCGNIYKHNDVGIRSSLVDRFAYGQPNFGKGTKKKHGWFYGFSADCWQAYAIGVTYIDMQNNRAI